MKICRVGRDGLIDVNDPRLEPALKERKETGRFTGELNLIRRDGTKFPAEVSSYVFTDSSGNDRTSMIIRDISKLKQTEVKLKENEIRLKVALSPIDISVFNQDVDLRYTWMFNPQLGYNTEQVIGKTDNDPSPSGGSASDNRGQTQGS